MHRELELLQRWKNEALDACSRMQGDMDSAQPQYQRQLQHNQKLQERLEHMSHKAKAAIAGLPLTTEPHSATGDALLIAPPIMPAVGPAPSRALSTAAPSLVPHELLTGTLARSGAGHAPRLTGGVLQHASTSLPLGPDVPERPDLPAQIRVSDV